MRDVDAQQDRGVTASANRDSESARTDNGATQRWAALQMSAAREQRRWRTGRCGQRRKGCQCEPQPRNWCDGDGTIRHAANARPFAAGGEASAHETAIATATVTLTKSEPTGVIEGTVSTTYRPSGMSRAHFHAEFCAMGQVLTASAPRSKR